MNTQIAILKSHTEVQDFEVIGQGGMVDKPCQIGEWWVMPADQYKGTIPPDIQAKWDNFKALNIPVLGYMIADDMRDVLLRRQKEAEERQARKEAVVHAAQEAAEVGAVVLAGIAKALGIVVVGTAALTAGMLMALVRFDPVLIAVMPDGRWVCLGAWWD